MTKMGQNTGTLKASKKVVKKAITMDLMVEWEGKEGGF